MKMPVTKCSAMLMLLLVIWGTEVVCAQEEYSDEQASYNLLLIGSDHRDDSWNGNSDVMILVTINQDSEEIILTSFMRDLYADIPGYGVHKLNYAFAVGGGDVLVQTLEDNYRLQIDNYAIVDFMDMVNIVDLLGGVEITLSDEECGNLERNFCISEGTECGRAADDLNGNS